MGERDASSARRARPLGVIDRAVQVMRDRDRRRASRQRRENNGDAHRSCRSLRARGQGWRAFDRIENPKDVIARAARASDRSFNFVTRHRPSLVKRVAPIWRISVLRQRLGEGVVSRRFLDLFNI
jgi:hypothetical protein